MTVLAMLLKKVGIPISQRKTIGPETVIRYLHIGIVLFQIYKNGKSYVVTGGQVECNSGPTKYPCGICPRSVKTAQHGVVCDNCDKY